MLLNQVTSHLDTPSLRTREDVVGTPTIVSRMRLEHKRAIRPSHGVSDALGSLLFRNLCPQLGLVERQQESPMQSEASEQLRPSEQALQYSPPQSTSVSSPLFSPSKSSESSLSRSIQAARISFEWVHESGVLCWLMRAESSALRPP